MENIESVKILVIGDIMLDKYVVGDIHRISPEAPVPIVNVKDVYYTLGGCGNVARNVAELGAQVDCLAAVGNDYHGKLVSNMLNEIGATPILLSQDETVTTIKERVISDDRKIQMIRIDYEKIEPIKASKLIDVFEKKRTGNYDMIVISDYAKGVVSKELIQYLKSKGRAKIIIDPKPVHAYMYDDVFMITPNEKESKKMPKITSQYILKTCGKNGMVLTNQKTQKITEIKSKPVSVYNVSGAGDVVIAMMAICLSKGLDIVDSAHIANDCAGYAVTQPQTCVVPKFKFSEIYNQYFISKK